MAEDYSVVDPDDVATDRFPESGLAHRKLTDALGCTAMRVNTITLDPGEATAPHNHERQEELYVALDGGHVTVDGTTHAVAPGGIVRVGADPVRHVHNESEAAQTWLMVGAPPHGTVADFGEYRMPEE